MARYSVFRRRPIHAMIYELVNLGRNLFAGLRLALFLSVPRLAFRIAPAQLLLLFAVSTGVDIGTDWIRYGPAAQFSWFGAGSEFFAAGLLLLSAAVVALAFRQKALALAIPVLSFAGFPVIQIVHTLPYVLSPVASFPEWLMDAFDIALVAWAFALFVRVVAVSLVPARSHRWPRALAGGLLLAAPIALAPALSPMEPWWNPASAAADDRYPNPASEPVLAAQWTLLDNALSNLDDERPRETDLYFVGFAGDARNDVYRLDVQDAQRTMDERWDTQGRSVMLVNSPATLLEMPMATVTHLRETLKEVAAAINPDEDVVMLYFAGPSDRDGTLDVAMPPLELAPLGPTLLRALLDEAGIRWRIVVVSACHAGAFVDALGDDYTLVMSAAAEGAAAGCGHGASATDLGAALFGDALALSDSFGKGFEAARAGAGAAGQSAIARADPGARLHVGPAMADKLKELDRGHTTRRAGQTI
jgi:hypothetical protein